MKERLFTIRSFLLYNIIDIFNCNASVFNGIIVSQQLNCLALIFRRQFVIPILLVYKLLKFIANKSGNVAIMFSLSLVPIMFSVGVSVDYSKIARIQSKLQEIADTAAFHAIKGHVDGDYGEEEITEIALQMVTSNYNIRPSDVDIQLNLTPFKF